LLHFPLELKGEQRKEKSFLHFIITPFSFDYFIADYHASSSSIIIIYAYFYDGDDVAMMMMPRCLSRDTRERR
jgi:hypothetical protein